ncbi:hypothetical protein B0T18DRAFT_389367 [Schizothecium vesticola]|uniref:Uncharacterized protein n=1 Tax=Schizothecium vesticola TaxID=314040 RepID=A0AA40F2A2_9PEZI|nr:hypothetical protein B0T18DRAFT_389367 [Schizothecium vesticola]
MSSINSDTSTSTSTNTATNQSGGGRCWAGLSRVKGPVQVRANEIGLQSTTTSGPMGSSTSVSIVASRPGLDKSRSMAPVGRDTLAVYETHLRRHGLMDTPMNIIYTPARPVNPFHTTGAVAHRPANLFRWARVQGRGGGVSGPGSVASGRGGGGSGPESVASGGGGGTARGGTWRGRGGGATGRGSIGQGRGRAAAGGVISGRVGDQGRGSRGRGYSRRGGALEAATLDRNRQASGWITHGQSEHAAEEEDEDEDEPPRPGLFDSWDQDAALGDAPGDEDTGVEQALDNDEIDVRGGMGEGEPEDQVNMTEEMEGERGDDSSMGETAVGQSGSNVDVGNGAMGVERLGEKYKEANPLHEGLEDPRVRGEEEQEKEVASEKEKEASRETLHALGLENEALAMEIKGVRANLEALNFEKQAMELRRQAQVLALEKEVKVLRAHVQEYERASASMILES